MKYLVVSTLDIEDKVEARCDTYEEAYEELLDRFFDYQRSCGYSEEDEKSGCGFKFRTCGAVS